MAKLVAVTGSSGFIASHIINEFLQRGYRVRAVVRDPSNEEKVAHLKAMAQGAPGSLEFASGDLLQAGSFDNAFAGVDVVVHSAAVVEITDVKDAQKSIIDPAVVGTKNILDSVDKEASVKAFVYTSTCLAVQSFGKPEGHVFTEEDWNDWSTIERGDPYGFGKTEAEKLIHERSKGKPYTVSVINPGVVLGPVFCKAHTKASTVLVRELLYSNPMNNYMATFVDVRDVAKAHVEAIERPAAAGQRFLVVGDAPCMATTALGAVAARALPQYVTGSAPKMSAPLFGLLSLLAQIPGIGSLVMSEFQRLASVTPINFSNAKAKQTLGMTFRPLDETLRDSAQSMVDGGYVKPKLKQ